MCPTPPFHPSGLGCFRIATKSLPPPVPLPTWISPPTCPQVQVSKCVQYGKKKVKVSKCTGCMSGSNCQVAPSTFRLRDSIMGHPLTNSITHLLAPITQTRTGVAREKIEMLRVTRQPMAFVSARCTTTDTRFNHGVWLGIATHCHTVFIVSVLVSFHKTSPRSGITDVATTRSAY